MERYDCRTDGSYLYLDDQQRERAELPRLLHEVRSAQLIVQTFTSEGQPSGVVLQKLDLPGRWRRPNPAGFDLADDFFEGRDALASHDMQKASAKAARVGTTCSQANARARPPKTGHREGACLGILPRSRQRVRRPPGHNRPEPCGSVAPCSTSGPVGRPTSQSSSTPAQPLRTEGTICWSAPRTTPTSTGVTACSSRTRMRWARLVDGCQYSRRPFPKRTGLRSA